MLTKEEQDVLNLLGYAFNEFVKLPVYHPDDVGEFRHAVHAAQNVVLARAGMRALNFVPLSPKVKKYHPKKRKGKLVDV